MLQSEIRFIGAGFFIVSGSRGWESTPAVNLGRTNINRWTSGPHFTHRKQMMESKKSWPEFRDIITDFAGRFAPLPTSTISSIPTKWSASHGGTRHGESFSTGTPTSSSASATLSDDPSATPRNPVRQNAEQIRAFA
jgi:hypothetical protein